MPSHEARQAMIDTLRRFPAALEAALEGLSDAQLDARPAPQEWSARQIAHHLADSHMNAFIRTKLLLTEDYPTVKPYHQEAWAELPDTLTLPPQVSLDILRGLHARWVALMESLTGEQWGRSGYHPESGEITVDDLLVTYAAHCDAHLEQIRRALGG